VRLKEGYDAFEASGKPPDVKVCGRQYMVNVAFTGQAADPAPGDPCPLYSKITPSGIDGVPATVLASLNRGESAPAAEPAQSLPSIALAALTPDKPAAPKPEAPHAIAAAMAGMSASPVITRPAPSQTASMQPVQSAPKAPAEPVYAAPSKPQAPVLAAAAASPVQSVNYSVGSAYAAPSALAAPASPPPAWAPADKAPDPDALQKTNRSGKGGKLVAPSVDASEAPR
jgi:hypothetical protein